MGMFDTLFINVNKLPVSEEEKKLIGNDQDWQTKDLDCCLDEVYITDNDELEILSGMIDPEKTDGIKGIVRENAMREKLPYTGKITFYSSINDDWYEFYASFTDGKMVEIAGGKKP